MDEFAVDPRAGARIDKMRTGDPTLANGTDAQSLVQPRQGVLGGAQRTHDRRPWQGKLDFVTH